MRVHLGPDHGCTIYEFWREWLKSEIPAAILELDGREPMKYFNATAANRYRHGLRTGYCATSISWSDRDEFLQDIFEINTSLPDRQGKPMKSNYLEQPKPMLEPAAVCVDHHSSFIGCFKDDKLVGYISANFCGELAAASQIIGHGDHLKNGVMLVLWAEFVRACQCRAIRIIVYSRWSDGKEGLKYWKHSVGMKPEVLKQV